MKSLALGRFKSFIVLYLFLLVVTCKSESYRVTSNQNHSTSNLAIQSTQIMPDIHSTNPSVIPASRLEDSFPSDNEYNYSSPDTNSSNSNSIEFVLTKENLQRLLLSIVYMLIIISCLVGNSLVIIAVIIVRKLHTKDNASNFLIVSLAVSDLLVGVLVMPYAFYVEMSEENKWYLGAILCDLWTMADVLLCTASILNLCAISIDRYFIIMHSLVYTQRRNAKLMLLMILIVWILSALISIPPLFGWGKPSSRLQNGGNICMVSQDLKYQLFATFLAFYLPLIIMIIIYFNIYRAAQKIKLKESETNGQLNYNNQTSAVFNSSNDQLNNGSNFTSPNTKSSIPILILADSDHINDGQLKSPNSRNSVFSNISRRVTQIFTNFKRSSDSFGSKNQKATKALGVIMGCFILCWLPFFTLALVKPLIKETNSTLDQYIPKWLDSFLLWLGYFNSSLNPMIYARFNREFRRPFIEIICFRCKDINERLRDLDRRRVQIDMHSAIKHKNSRKRSSIVSTSLLIKNNISNGIITKLETESVKIELKEPPSSADPDHPDSLSKVVFVQKSPKKEGSLSDACLDDQIRRESASSQKSLKVTNDLLDNNELKIGIQSKTAKNSIYSIDIFNSLSKGLDVSRAVSERVDSDLESMNSLSRKNSSIGDQLEALMTKRLNLELFNQSLVNGISEKNEEEEEEDNCDYVKEINPSAKLLYKSSYKHDHVSEYADYQGFTSDNNNKTDKNNSNSNLHLYMNEDLLECKQQTSTDKENPVAYRSIHSGFPNSRLTFETLV